VRVLVIGAGGHAKVVIDAARRCGYEIAGVVGGAGGATEVLGVPVSQEASGVHADGFIVAIGDNATRAREFERCIAMGMSPISVVHPSAVIAEQVRIGSGTFVAAGVIVNVDARIGENAILNTGCTVDHDCMVGDHALIGPTASLCGGVSVGVGTLVGAGTSLIPRSSVGDWSVVGAGATVVSALPSHSISVGVPAAVVRKADAE